MMMCVNCKYYVVTETGADYGECYRYPPRDRFPLVNETEWCGEFHLVEDRVAIGERIMYERHADPQEAKQRHYSESLTSAERNK